MIKTFHDMMKTYKDSQGDYYIYLSRSGADKIKNPVNLYHPPLEYNWLKSQVSLGNRLLNEYLFLTCSNDSSTAYFPGGITLSKEDSENPKDSIVRIFPTALDSLLNNEREFLMTRYNGEDKVWIYISV